MVNSLRVSMPPGKYVLAVSGGVDSVVLLDILRQTPDVELVVAHFDHGIRNDSRVDHNFVQDLSSRYKLAFVSAEGNLGTDASEELARTARYEFLRNVQAQTGARAVVTAHHQDDIIESIIMNVLRGTGRKGLASLRSTDTVVRPLLHAPKTRLKAYAHAQNLQWREDSTNSDTRYFRNHVRHHIVPHLSVKDRAQLLKLYQQTDAANAVLDKEIAKLLHIEKDHTRISRGRFIMLPHHLAADAMAVWLRANHLRDFDHDMINRLVVAAKTLPAGRTVDVMRGYHMKIEKNTLTIGSQVTR